MGFNLFDEKYTEDMKTIETRKSDDKLNKSIIIAVNDMMLLTFLKDHHPDILDEFDKFAMEYDSPPLKVDHDY